MIWGLAATSLLLMKGVHRLETYAAAIVAKPAKYSPEGIFDALKDNDVAFTANNRGDIRAEWTRPYDRKSDPKYYSFLLDHRKGADSLPLSL